MILNLRCVFLHILLKKLVIISIFIITAGCLIAFIGDLEFDSKAYLAGLVSVFAQGGYLTAVQLASSKEASLKQQEV